MMTSSWLQTVLAVLLCCSVVALDNGVARLPPMGWMSWLRFGCNIRCDIDPVNCISERLYTEIADRLVADGYRDVGYEFIIIDDCWMAQSRDENNKLQADVTRFPRGIKYLADYMHSRQLKLGIYLDLGVLTCANYPGSRDFLELDAMTLAEWNVDFVKLDGCNIINNTDYDNGYRAMGRYLNETGRPIVYSCLWPMYARYHGLTVDYNVISSTCNMFRVLMDMDYTFYSITILLDYFASDPQKLSSYTRPGAWNDPDQLVLGNDVLSDNQEQVQMAMWSMWSSPLIMSNDLRHIPVNSKAILLNRDVIGINQDKLATQATLVLMLGNISVWKKPVMPNGSYAVAILNRATSGGPQLASLRLCDVISDVRSYHVTELFEGRYLGKLKCTQKLEIRVKPSGVYLMKAVPAC